MVNYASNAVEAKIGRKKIVAMKRRALCIQTDVSDEKSAKHPFTEIMK